VEYSVPMEEAERTLRRRYDADESDVEQPSEQKRLSELSSDDSRVAVEALVLCAGKRTIQTGGDETTIVEGELADSSGVISFTAWEEFGLEEGDEVRVEGADVREWDGEPQLNLGNETRVEEAEGVEPPRQPYGTRRLADLSEGDRAVSVDVRVVESEERVINGRDGETTITSGVLGDSSGRLPFTDWENRDVEEGESYSITNAYVNEYRGVPQVNMGEYTEVTRSDDVDVSETAPETSIADAVDKGGAFDVLVEGDILSVKEGSGLIKRCPDCGRVVQKGQCRSHGDVDGDSDMRTKAVFDDGTGALTLVLGRDITEEVYGGSLEDAEDEAREAMDQTVVKDRIADRIVGRRYRVRGNVSVGEYGANIEATEMEEATRPVEEEAEEVLDEYV
ncbi:MAG: Single-stranded DNA binding protein, partial [Halobacteria archaeon]|nr:Single-stranded DNA binding protein [Halobacteria archaeon]